MWDTNGGIMTKLVILSNAVADDYSNVNFNTAENADGAGNVDGSYYVALPDGSTQYVNYHSNGYEGYVADVTYDGVAAYPDVPDYCKPSQQEHTG